MKKIFCTLALSVMALTAFSQEIKIGRGQVLYHIPSPNIVLSARQHVPYNAVIQTVNIVPAKWKIVKFVNMGNQNTKNYDAMIIQSAGTFKKMEQRTYLLRYQDLSDEHKRIIDNANYKLDSVFVAKQNQIAELEEQIEEEKTDNTKKVNDYILSQIKEKEDSIQIFKEKCEELLVKLKNESIAAAKHYKDSLYKTYTAKESAILKHIVFTKVSLKTDSAGGNDVTINYINTSDKTIKYIWFSCDYYNRVNDKVYCDIRGSKLQCLKETGPIEPGSEGEGGEWEHVIYNYEADYVIIKNIQINYIDGSTYNVSLTKKEFEHICTAGKLVDYYESIMKLADSIPVKIEDKTFESQYGWTLPKTNLTEWIANHNFVHYYIKQTPDVVAKEKFVDIVSNISKLYNDVVKEYSDKCTENIRVFQNEYGKNRMQSLSLSKYNLENDRTEYEVNVNEDWNYYFVNM